MGFRQTLLHFGKPEAMSSRRLSDAAPQSHLSIGRPSVTEVLPTTIPESVGHSQDPDFSSYSHEPAEAPVIPRTRSRQSAYDTEESMLQRHSSFSQREEDLPVEPDFADMEGTYNDERAQAHNVSRPESAASERYYNAPTARTVSPETVNFEGRSTRSPSVKAKSIMSKVSHQPSSASSFAPSNSTLAPLQTKGAGNNDGLEPLAEEEIDPASFDLVVPANAPTQYSLEERSELLFSKEHLKIIFEDPTLLQRFTTFLCAAHPSSVPVLVYYLDALKALKALEYVNSITKSLKPLDGFGISQDPIQQTANEDLQAKADQAFELLTREDLPAYITHTWVRTVSVTIKRRIADTLPAHLRDLSEGLAEVFCLTDPSRPDNPIIFASEEFHRTTQYGMNYVLGRNCRFLQGPKTNPTSVRRLKEMVMAGKEHCETFLNYRRDGSPFMNLLMVAPLFDSRGNVRYYIGAQVDVSGLVKECSGLESLERLVQKHEAAEAERDGKFDANRSEPRPENDKDAFRNLAEMFSLGELKAVREHGGSLHRTRQSTSDSIDEGNLTNWNKPRLHIRDDASVQRRDSDPIMNLPSSTGGKLSGVYENYLLVRPYPSLRILFASPHMRVPGMLQSSFMNRIGGSRQVRDALTQAFADGHGVTAKVRWITDVQTRKRDSLGAKDTGKGRWIHCTPLLGGNGAVGVWMVVLVDDEVESSMRRTRDAPPVSRNIGYGDQVNEFDRQSFAGGQDHHTMGGSTAGGSRPASRMHTASNASHRTYNSATPDLPLRNDRRRQGDETPDVDDVSLGGGSYLDSQISARHQKDLSQGDLKDLKRELSAKRNPQHGSATGSYAGSMRGSIHGRTANVDPKDFVPRPRVSHSRLKAALPSVPAGAMVHEGVPIRPGAGGRTASSGTRESF